MAFRLAIPLCEGRLCRSRKGQIAAFRFHVSGIPETWKFASVGGRW